MKMKSLRWMVLCALALLAAVSCSAQQKFPLRAGEWEAKVTDSSAAGTPMTLKYCLNDELWTKALSRTSCSIQQLQVTPIGASYNLDCSMKSIQVKGKIEMSFDGMEHMTAKGTIDTVVNGNTTSSVSHVDYRWKAAVCSPDDMNLRHPR